MNCKKSEHMPEWLVEELTKHGLTKSQATSKTAEAIVDALNTPENAELIAYTKDKCDAMVRQTQSQIAEMRATHKRLSEEVEKVSNTILAIKSATEEFGELSDQRAKDALMFYSAFLAIGKEYGAVDITGGSYNTYAYLGGDVAKYNFPKSEKDRIVIRKPKGIRREVGTEDIFEF